MERGLDPLTTHLVVADESRTEKTICLAVSPSLKAYGIPGRPRLFEVIQRVRTVNEERARRIRGHTLNGSSCQAGALANDPTLALSYITAPPRMSLYMKYSTHTYEIYLKYAAPEDIHVYSVDEVFIDVTHYLRARDMRPEEFLRKILLDVLHTTGITATAGIGTNLYLAKVAMDIVAKHMPPDKHGVRIASLDEQSYRKMLWDHRPLTDFWRIGKGYARRLEAHRLYTMGDIARCSVGKAESPENEELLYRLFGINAELLIDHAWGWEPCTMEAIKRYRPSTKSLSIGQVLPVPYPYLKARLALLEMADLLSFDLVRKGLLSDQLSITVGYDRENLRDPEIRRLYHGKIDTDPYGRPLPQQAHGTETLHFYTSSGRVLMDAARTLFDRIANPALLVRRLNIVANRARTEIDLNAENAYTQLSFFSIPELEALNPMRENGLSSASGSLCDATSNRIKRTSRSGGSSTGCLSPATYSKKDRKEEEQKEHRMQETVLTLRKRFGKNAVLRGINLEEGAMTRTRNRQIGGHNA